MALKTDLRKAIHDNTKLKVNRINYYGGQKVTLNGKYTIHVIHVLVKNKKSK